MPFRIGPTPDERIVRGLESPLAGTSASAREIEEQRVAETGGIVEAHGAIEQNEARSRDVVARLDAARRRLAQHCTGQAGEKRTASGPRGGEVRTRSPAASAAFAALLVAALLVAAAAFVALPAAFVRLTVALLLVLAAALPLLAAALVLLAPLLAMALLPALLAALVALLVLLLAILVHGSLSVDVGTRHSRSSCNARASGAAISPTGNAKRGCTLHACAA